MNEFIVSINISNRKTRGFCNLLANMNKLSFKNIYIRIHQRNTHTSTHTHFPLNKENESDNINTYIYIHK